MATLTLGTNATTTLTALRWIPGATQADLATIRNAILDDQSRDSGQLAITAPSAKPIWPGALSATGHLYIPNRGILQILPGDYIGVDANGWPILLSANAIAGGTSPSATTSWTKSA